MNLTQHINKNFQLAIPVMLTQVGQILVNVADNVMVGGIGDKNDIIQNPELGKLALGAVALGNAVFFSLLVAAIGFSFAMSPLIAEADAKNNIDRVNRIFTHGFFLNVIFATVLMCLVFAGIPFMYHLNQPESVVDLAIPYLKIQALSMIPVMIFQSFRQFSEGLSLVVNVTIATILANVINIILNYAWIYGNWGFPRLEVEGAAYGTLVSRIFMVIFLIIAMYKHPKSKLYLKRINKTINKNIFKRLLKLGTPTSLQMFFEFGAFSVAAFICGMAGETDLAAHQIALNLVSISFMLCTGLAVAATIRIGNQMGLRDSKTLRKAGWSAILMSVFFMFICGIIFITGKNFFPELYIDNVEVTALAASLMIIAALFQLSDGIQLVTLGALRGLQDVNIPMITTFLAYFAIAIPVGYFFGIHQKMGAFGVWIGLGVGLTISAVLLLIRFHKKTKALKF